MRVWLKQRTVHTAVPVSISDIQIRDATNPCQDFLDSIKDQPPAYPVGATPLKSVAGFQLLAYALEAIRGKTFESMLNDRILNPLHMTSTSLSTPKDSANALIPDDGIASLWSLDLGDQTS